MEELRGLLELCEAHVRSLGRECEAGEYEDEADFRGCEEGSPEHQTRLNDRAIVWIQCEWTRS